MRAISIIEAVVDINPSEQAKRSAKTYWIAIKSLKVALIVLGSILVIFMGMIFGYESLFYDLRRIYWLLLFLIFAICLSYIIVKRNYVGKLMPMLFVCCDPIDFLDNYLALLNYAKKSTPAVEGIWNTCGALLFSARHDDVSSILEAWKPFIKGDDDKARYHALAILHAYETNNLALLEEHTACLEEFRQSGATSKLVYSKTETYLDRLPLLEMELSDDLPSMLEVFSEMQEIPNYSMPNKVLLSFRIANLARKLGDIDTAKQYYEYAAANGNTMHAAQEAQLILSDSYGQSQSQA